MNITKDKTPMINNNQSRFQIIRNPGKTAKFENNFDTPLRPVWSFGWNCKIGLKSIFVEDLNEIKPQMFFVSDQIGIILEYDTLNKENNTMTMLTGHRNYISSFDVNPDSRWLVTVDKGDNDTMLIVWNVLLRTPVYSVLSPFEMGISIVKFSVDSQYVITVSVADTNGEQTIDVWEWTSGKEESACSTKLDNSIDTIVHLACCYDNTNFYCLTTEKLVFFMTLERMDKNIKKKKKIPTTNLDNVNKIIINVPTQDAIQKKYINTQSAYLTSTRQVVSATTKGWVTVWDDNNYNASTVKDEPITNNKQYLKRVKLDEHSITTIICIQTHIITGNTNGDVIFYDKSLRVLYHLNVFVGDPITSISMLNNKMYIENGRGNSSTHEKTEKDLVDKTLLVDDFVLECDSSPEIGADFSTGQDFKSSPFLISTRNCRIFKIDISNKSSDYIFDQCEVEFITALAVHPTRNIIMGNSIGGLIMFDYQKKKTIISMIGDRKIKEDHQVTCIKYSTNGNYLCYGRSDGLFQFVDPYTLTPMKNKSFNWNKSPVQHITFSDSSKYVVYTDNSFGIYMYGMIQLQKSNKFKVKYYGCFEAHNKLIRSILLSEYSTSLMIYSVGADHKIIALEFDKTKDKEPPKIVKTMKTESFNEPQCMMKSTINKQEFNFMISGNDLRLSLWDNNRCICTTQGVNLESPIRVMKESPKFNNDIFFCNDTDIGIIRQPIDGNPYKNAAVLGSGKKIIDIGVSMDGMYIFSISENSPSMIIWSVHRR
eukprot:XP_003246262.1 PREDICTED: WD repeat-containing protein 66-like [Acyrthosiphon pisum]